MRTKDRLPGRLIWITVGVGLLCLGRSSAALTATTTALALSSTSQASGTALTLTATVVAGATPVTLGTVVFCNASATYCMDSAVVGTAQLTSAGTASIKIIPSIGSHSYKATFRLTANYLSSTSASRSVTVSGRFASATAISSSGSAGSYTLTGQVVTTGSFAITPTGSVTFIDTSNSNYPLGSATLGSSTLAQTFAVTSVSSVGAGPRLLASGDFNGDGIPDVAISSQSNGSVTVLLGTGNGTFTAATGSPITFGNSVIAVATGDLNNDGKLDIVAVDFNSNSIDVLLGNGDGTFRAAITTSGIGNGPDSVAIGDFNGDGYLDVAVPVQNGNGVYVALGLGTGAFNTPVFYNTGTGPYSVSAQDLNGDGYLDLVIGNAGASSVTVLLGTGTGTFTAAAGSPFTTGSGAWSIVLADLNGDGKTDLVVADQNDANLSILNGNGDGTFATFSSYALASGIKFVTAADFNGDGNQDIAVCNVSASTISLLLGNGNRTFQTAQSYSASGSFCTGIITADFNGDGLPDLQLSIAGNSTSAVLLNTVTHTASASISAVSIPGSGSHSVAAAYAGDSQDAASTSSAISLTASKIATNITLSAAPSSSSYGQQAALTGTLSPYSVGSLTTSGESITFYNGATALGTGTLSSGVASLNVTSLPVGTDSLTVAYTADANFLGSTSSVLNYVVTQVTPAITWTTPSPITYGTALSSIQLNASSGGVAGTFTYTPASGTILSAGNGQTLAVSFTPTNSMSYSSANGSTTINVSQAVGTISLGTSAASSAYGSTVTLTATLPGNATGTVTFRDGGTAIGSGMISGTTVTFTSSSLAVGSHSLTATWPGDINYTAAASTALMQTIVRAAAVVAEVSSRNPSLYGDTVNFSISVSGSGATPTGMVVLKDGAATLATVTLAAGSATVVTSALVVGSHTLNAIYQGDTNYF